MSDLLPTALTYNCCVAAKEPSRSTEPELNANDFAARVEGYVHAALESLPGEYASKLENVQFFVERVLSFEEGRRLGVRPGSLYGLYEGIPLTRRGDWYNFVMPDKITVFWGPIVRDYPDEEALADKVRTVVYHEIGHYFGMSEGDLSQTRMK
jgi:predicted Zn-dependent protease with MMP-like domain